MSTLVVSTQGAVLHCTGGQIVVRKDQAVIARMPLEQVDRVLLLGGVGFTTGFVTFALDHRAPVTFLSQDGRYRGRLDPGERRSVELRQAQYRRLEDMAWRVQVSRQIVRAKVEAQRRLLLRSDRGRGDERLQGGARQMAGMLAKLDEARTLAELMGMEGMAARAYFGALPAALRRPLDFSGRSRRPPRDPVNALLSLGYGLLTAEIVGALAAVGLDPQVGIFHTARGRMPALAEDILELFRAPAADALALSLVNLRVMQEDDFERTAVGGVLLNRSATDRFFRHYRRRMQASFRDRSGQVTSFRREVQEQAAHLRRVYLGQEEYEPFEAPGGGQYPVSRREPPATRGRGPDHRSTTPG